MSTLANLLLGIVKPAISRGLAALGMGVVSVTGVTSVFDSVRDQIISNLNGAPLDMLQMMGLAGIWEALGMVFGATTAALSWVAMSKFTKIVGL